MQQVKFSVFDIEIKRPSGHITLAAMQENSYSTVEDGFVAFSDLTHTYKAHLSAFFLMPASKSA